MPQVRACLKPKRAQKNARRVFLGLKAICLAEFTGRGGRQPCTSMAHVIVFSDCTMTVAHTDSFIDQRLLMNASFVEHPHDHEGSRPPMSNRWMTLR
jgi:hypothetical protein